ncbi:hypothetical protein PEC18_17670 [Paucibacter sp. O1-1]|nr:hypothetical protein [Paucibacter sp. O1-1]MDA3827628.1 hypothetical protein [Paucibacter sp. O1-1]
MTKILAIMLLAATLLALALQSVPPVTAAAVSTAVPSSTGVAPMPAPKEPFDTTPISAVETVGAARGD